MMHNNLGRVTSNWMLCLILRSFFWMACTVVADQEHCENEGRLGPYQPCPFNSSSVRCVYTRNSVDRPIAATELGFNAPGSASDLSVSPVPYIIDSQHYVRVNISWRLPQDPSYRALNGFQLKITFSYNNTNYEILRTFNVYFSSSDYSIQLQNVYFYDCVTVFSDTQYDITLYSLPVSSSTVNYVTKTFITSHDITNGQLLPTANNTDDWSAAMFVLPDPASNCIDVCFHRAPEHLQYSSYIIDLIPLKTSTNILQNSRIFVTPDVQDKQTCVRFSRVQPLWYNVSLSVNNTYCTCLGNSSSDCPLECALFQATFIDMTTALPVPVALIPTPLTTATTFILQYTGPTPTSATPLTLEASQPLPVTSITLGRIFVLASISPYYHSKDTGTTESEAKDSGALIGLILGLFLGIILLTMLLIFTLCVIRKREKYWHSKNVNHQVASNVQTSAATAGEEINARMRKRVLLIYSRDNEAHRDVVCRFASFLHKCCECDVIIDEWSMGDITQTSSGEWLNRQLETVFNIIVIHSEGGFKLYKASRENKAYIQSDYVEPLDDLFVTALKFLQRDNVTERRCERNCIHVYFSQYTGSRHIVDIKFGNRIPLMNCMKRLYNQIHDPKSATEQQVSDMTFMTDEGKQLQLAIQAAVEFQKRNPNWLGDCKIKELNVDRRQAKHRQLDHQIPHTINKRKTDINANLESDISYLQQFSENRIFNNATATKEYNARPVHSLACDAVSMNRQDSAYESGLNNKGNDELFSNAVLSVSEKDWEFVPPATLFNASSDEDSSLNSVKVDQWTKAFNNCEVSHESSNDSVQPIKDCSEC